MGGGVPDRELYHEISLCYVRADGGILTFQRNFLPRVSITALGCPTVPQKGLSNGLVRNLFKCTSLWPSPSSSHRDTVSDTIIYSVVGGCVLLQVKENRILDRMLK